MRKAMQMHTNRDMIEERDVEGDCAGVGNYLKH